MGFLRFRVAVFPIAIGSVREVMSHNHEEWTWTGCCGMGGGMGWSYTNRGLSVLRLRGIDASSRGLQLSEYAYESVTSDSCIYILLCMAGTKKQQRQETRRIRDTHCLGWKTCSRRSRSSITITPKPALGTKRIYSRRGRTCKSLSCSCMVTATYEYESSSPVLGCGYCGDLGVDMNVGTFGCTG